MFALEVGYERKLGTILRPSISACGMDADMRIRQIAHTPYGGSRASANVENRLLECLLCQLVKY